MRGVFRRVGVAVLFGAALAVALEVHRNYGMSLYESGRLQSPLSYANAFLYVLSSPVDRYLDPEWSGRARSSQRVAALFLLHSTLGFGAASVIRWSLPRRRAAALPPPSADGPSRRELLRRTAQVAVGGSIAALSYGVFVEPRRLQITRHRIPIRDLDPALDGLRIVHFTDQHHGPWFSRDYIRKMVSAVNRLEPDLVALTGDFVSRSAAYIRPVSRILAELRPRIASVGVLGNHDWWEDGPLTHAALREAGVRMLDNTRLVLAPDRTLSPNADRGLVIGGVGDLWTDRQDYAAALAGPPRRMPRLLLAHNPDTAEESALTAAELRIDLMLSGHTHGGQVALGGMTHAPLPSKFGIKYAQGLINGPVCPVYVCRGTGMSFMPVRMGVRPEIAVLELQSA